MTSLPRRLGILIKGIQGDPRGSTNEDNFAEGILLVEIFLNTNKFTGKFDKTFRTHPCPFFIVASTDMQPCFGDNLGCMIAFSSIKQGVPQINQQMY